MLQNRHKNKIIGRLAASIKVLKKRQQHQIHSTKEPSLHVLPLYELHCPPCFSSLLLSSAIINDFHTSDALTRVTQLGIQWALGCVQVGLFHP